MAVEGGINLLCQVECVGSLLGDTLLDVTLRVFLKVALSWILVAVYHGLGYRIEYKGKEKEAS